MTRNRYTTRICPASNNCPRDCHKTVNKGKRYICDHWGFPKGSDEYNRALQTVITARKRWNKSTKIIPQKNEFALRGITQWRIGPNFKLYLEYRCNLRKAVSEAKHLLDTGFIIGWAHDTCCGWIEKGKPRRYTVHKSVYGCQFTPLTNVSLTKAIKYAKTIQEA